MFNKITKISPEKNETPQPEAIYDPQLDAEQRRRILREVENEKRRGDWEKISEPVYPDARTCEVPGCGSFFDNSSDYLAHMNASQEKHRKLLEQDFKRKVRARKALEQNPIYQAQQRAIRGDEFRDPNEGVIRGESIKCPHCSKIFER